MTWRTLQFRAPLDPPKKGEDTDTWVTDRLARFTAATLEQCHAAGYTPAARSVVACIAGPFEPVGGGKPRSLLAVSIILARHTPERLAALAAAFAGGQADPGEAPPAWPPTVDPAFVAAWEAGRECRVGPAPYRPDWWPLARVNHL